MAVLPHRMQVLMLRASCKPQRVLDASKLLSAYAKLVQEALCIDMFDEVCRARDP